MMEKQQCCSFILFALDFEISQDSNTWHNPVAFSTAPDWNFLEHTSAKHLCSGWKGVNMAQEIPSNLIVLAAQVHWTFEFFSY